MGIELSGRISKGEIISRIREDYVNEVLFTFIIVIGIYIRSTCYYWYYVYVLVSIQNVDTIQRLGKYKWYAYSFQTATEKEGTSINPQYMFLVYNNK